MDQAGTITNTGNNKLLKSQSAAADQIRKPKVSSDALGFFAFGVVRWNADTTRIFIGIPFLDARFGVTRWNADDADTTRIFIGIPFLDACLVLLDGTRMTRMQRGFYWCSFLDRTLLSDVVLFRSCGVLVIAS